MMLTRSPVIYRDELIVKPNAIIFISLMSGVLGASLSHYQTQSNLFRMVWLEILGVLDWFWFQNLRIVIDRWILISK